MRLDMQRERKLAKRKGLALKTILATFWLTLCFIFAYFLIDWLIDSEVISTEFFYSRLLIPRSVDETIILAGLMVLVVFVMQFFVMIGYAFSSSIGKRRPGTPTSEARNPDPHDSRYNYR